MKRLRLALSKKKVELGIEVPSLEVKKYRADRCPAVGTRVIYFFVNHGELSYIGMTKSFQKRLNRHKHSGYNKLRDRTGIYYQEFDISYKELREIEATLIRLLQPKHNLQA